MSKDHRLMRVPAAQYQQAMKLQAQIMQQEGLRVPMWQCFVKLQTPSAQPPMLRRIRL